MREEKTEGILLQAIPYLGKEKILKILSQNDGLISLISKNSSHLPLTNPFLLAEWIYKRKNNGIHTLKDVSLHKHFSDLRNCFETLQHAGQIAQDILFSQLPEKKGNGPYALATAYLSKLPEFANPEAMVASFRLKLLMHDGLLGLQTECTQCENPATHLEGGESFCKTHSFPTSIPFDVEEWKTLHLLTFARQFSALKTVSLSQPTQEKIRNFFYALYKK